jgi:cysteinyl-tRNA synthetase
MIGKHLGKTIDIHGGGQDLIFPHHENEVAQGTCANNGQLYCRTWVHNSFVTVDGQKMSKSLGNVLLISDLLAHMPGEAIRYALLMTHYRHPLDWNPIRLGRAKAMLIRFYRALSRVKGIPASMNEQPDPTVLAAVAEDLNTPLALARLQRLIPLLGKTSDETVVAKAKGKLLASGAVLGLLQQDPDAVLTQFARGGETPEPAWIADLINSRTTARQEGDYAKADELRLQLAKAGVALEDSDGVTHWRLTNMEAL